MTRAEDHLVPDLLRAVRARIWAQDALALTVRALWASGVLLLALGLTHVALTSLPAVACLAAGTLPIPLAVLWATLFRRPGLATAARTADRWLEAKALLTSAWDVLEHRQAHSPGAAAQVLRQALAAVPAWRRDLRARQPLRVPRTAVIPVVLGLAGGLLLTSVGADASADLVAVAPASGASAPPLPGDRGAAPASPGGPAGPSPRAPSEPTTVRPRPDPPGAPEGAAQPAPGPGRPASPHPRAADRGSGASTPPEAVTSATASLREADAAAAPAAAPGLAPTAPGQGDAPGGESPPRWEAADASLPRSGPAEHVDLAAAAGDAAYRSAAPGPGPDPLAPAEAHDRAAARPVPPASPPSAVAAARSTPLALRGYVADYFQRLHVDPP